jgi:hypothetical protein
MSEYQTYTCIKCGDPKACNSYCEPYKTRMTERQMCFTCSHWTDFDLKLEKKHDRETIIEGNVYEPGSRTSGSFRGMGGRRFDIEYIEPSIHAGKRITTFDLWSGGQMPDWLRAKWPDTARFLGGAERVNLESGDIYEACWNASVGATIYPLPSMLV